MEEVLLIISLHPIMKIPCVDPGRINESVLHVRIRIKDAYI